MVTAVVVHGLATGRQRASVADSLGRKLPFTFLQVK